MLESWKVGLKETSIQNVYGIVDFLILMAYFFNGKYQKIESGEHHQKK